MKHSWQPLVHGRTYEVDYRSNLLAVPHWFKPEDVARVMPFILGTFDTFLVKGLPEPIHWSVFKDEDYCVVGLTCMAHQVSDDMNRDAGNRVLPVFLGYVTLETPAHIVLPRLEIGKDGNPKAVDGQFSELYQYVKERWYEKRQVRDLYSVKDTFELEVAEYSPSPDMWPDARLNIEEDKMKLWPVRKEESHWFLARDEALWAAASQCRYPVSLCLGLSRQGTAISGPFLNATAYDIQEPVILNKPAKEPPMTGDFTNQNHVNSPSMGEENLGERPSQQYLGHEREPSYRIERFGIRLSDVGKAVGKAVGGLKHFVSSTGELRTNYEALPPYPPGPDAVPPSTDLTRTSTPSLDHGLQDRQRQPNFSEPDVGRSVPMEGKKRYEWEDTSAQIGRDSQPQHQEMQDTSPAPPRKRDWFGKEQSEQMDAGKDAQMQEPPIAKAEGVPKRDWFKASAGPSPDEKSEEAQDKQQENPPEEQTGE